MPIRWDEIDDFVRAAAEDAAATDTLVAPMFLAYDEQGPASCLTLRVPAGEVSPGDDELVRTCVGLFAPLRPVRFAAVWPMLLDLPDAPPEMVSDDGYVHGLRVVRGEVVAEGPPRWTWTSVGYRRVGGAVTVWAPDLAPEPLDRLRCTLARGLPAVLEEGDRRWRGGPLVEIPGPPYVVLLRPGMPGRQRDATADRGEVGRRGVHHG